MLAEISKWVILIIIIGVVILIIKAGMKIINVALMVLILGFAWFSFFTDQGAARLSIALSGHPIVAYTTHLEKQESISNDNVIYFTSSKPLETEYAKCNKVWIVRLPIIE